MKGFTRGLAFMLIASLGSAAALAHHSFAAEFDIDKPVDFRGKVVKVELINPHSWIHLEVTDATGAKTVWMIEGGSPNQLLRKGFDKNSLPIGTELQVVGYQARDGAKRAVGRTLKLANGQSLFFETTPIPERSRVEITAHPAPLEALASGDATLGRNKRAVFDMWRSIVNAGHVEVADELLVEGYVQHSPVLRTGRKAFKEIFSVVPRRDMPPVVEPPLLAMVAEGDLVVMSLRESVPARDATPAYVTAHFNLFRLEGGKLAEHWHSVHTPPGADVPLPEDGGPQPVVGAVGEAQAKWLASQDPALARHKRLVFGLWREIVEAGREEDASRYVGARFIDHHPGGGQGTDGFRQYFAARRDQPVQPWIGASVVAMVAENDLVALVTRQEHAHPSRPGRTYTTTWFDLLRIENGRVVEHWDDAVPGEMTIASAW